MKILAIRGKNLASLDQAFEIDFSTAPLQSAGIYAITGQTGAGKSTILDALCLALFDDTPRLNKAELIKREDLESLSDKISPSDCRNILRRGASDGYAEVDFIALDGDQYRSRWVVRRARGKVDGALQPTSMILENLSNGTQVQGTKKDLLNRVTEIIGLTFYQFTRAVLLAQGEFANFLKARQNEKAELLEKLTGTAVYSKISIRIYHATLDAKNLLDLIRQRISDVRLLEAEELLALKDEKLLLVKKSETLKLRMSVIEKKLAWISEEALLKEELSKAENELVGIQLQIRQAAPRFQYMNLIDISQEIRDVYNELLSVRTQSEKLAVNLGIKEKETGLLMNKVHRVTSDLKVAESAVDETMQKYNDLRPEIAKAKALDFEIALVAGNLKESRKTLEDIRNQFNSAELHITSLQKSETVLNDQRTVLTSWFVRHEPYKAIISKSDYIISLIGNAYTLRKQYQSTLLSLDTAKSMMKTYQTQLDIYVKESDRLNHLLPAEVMNLRKTLEDGKPCPVCGSMHHPMQGQNSQQDEMDGRILESEREKIIDHIAQVTNQIEATHKNITEFEVHALHFKNQYDSVYGELNTLFHSFPVWQDQFSKGCLMEKLTNVTNKWNENKERLDQCNQQIELVKARLEAATRNLNTIREQLNEQIKRDALTDGIHRKLLLQREQLLENKRVEDVELYYEQLNIQKKEIYERLRREKESIENEMSMAAGVLNQLKKDMAVNDIALGGLLTDIREWHERNNHQISSEVFNDLMSKSHEWIRKEKAFLNELNIKELVCRTTLSERMRQLMKHQESDQKLSDGETKESLSLALDQMVAESEMDNKRLSEISVSLLTHQRGEEQVKAFEKELTEKTALYNNWAKLNDLLGSASGNKFKTIAQGYTLDVLLSFANKHLAELTRRYQLEKIPGTLALQVVDNDMLGEVRTVHSLSGGESFLISLALALGLSSLSSNRMKIESLFIDEGFGALDMETLNVAMDALDHLQVQGRKIGVISHVEEMKERITTRVQVIKTSNGRSTITITG